MTDRRYLPIAETFNDPKIPEKKPPTDPVEVAKKVEEKK